MSVFRKLVRPNSFIVRKGKYILIFLHGFLLASLAYFFIEKQYENKIFASIAAYLQGSFQSTNSSGIFSKEDSLLIKSVHLVHALGSKRSELFGKYPVEGIKANFIQPVGFDFMTGQGACGSYAYVLGRLLQEMKIEVRFPQMTVKNQPAGHIIVEAKTVNGWVTLDASSDVFFRKQDGNLAGFDDVKNNWDFYRSQLPPDYNMAYRYEGVRYTNWDKIPVIMPLIKNVMYLAIGKKNTDNYSLRSLMLKKYNFLFNITAGFYLLVVLFSINAWIRTRRIARNRFQIQPIA